MTPTRTNEPTNWREWCVNPPEDGAPCNESVQTECPEPRLSCNECRASAGNTARTAYIAECQMKLAKEKEPMTTELKSLANSEQFPEGVGVAVNREMMVWHLENKRKGHVTSWTGKLFALLEGGLIPNAAEIPVKKERPLTAFEIAMLPRGTAFVDNNGTELYQPSISYGQTDIPTINGTTTKYYKGYRLPGETEIRPFTKVEE